MKKTLVLFTCIFFITISKAIGSDKIIDVTKHGIKSNSETKCTTTLQNLIDKLSLKGGGILRFPAGYYLTGSFEIKSGVKIYLEKDAIIKGSTNPYDYNNKRLNEPKSPNAKDNSSMALVVANNACNIAILGEGTIDGNGRELALNIDSLHHKGIRIDSNYNTKRMRPNETARPKLFRFSNCQNIDIKGVELRNSACWGVTIELCSNVIIDNVKVFNRAYWNNDGIDITDCKNVKITNCNINAADDGICLKSYYPGYCNDSIYITNCNICSSASAVKFGTASHGGFRNINIDSIQIYDTFRSAIAIESVDGGFIENVQVSNIKARNTGNAIFVRLGSRSGKSTGILRNIHLNNIEVEIPFGRPDSDYDMRGPAVNFFHNPIPSSITGIPGQKVENIVIENLRIICPGRASKGMAYIPLWRIKDVPEKVNEYPEFSMFGELPSWGFYIRHVNGITFKNITLKLKEKDYRPAFIFDDVDNICLDNINIPVSSKEDIILRKSNIIRTDRNYLTNIIE